MTATEGLKPRSVFRPGEVFILTQGEYSSYEVLALCRVIVEFDVTALVAEWLKDHPEQLKNYHFKTDAFHAWMSARGLWAEVPHGEFFLGDYGSYGTIHGYAVEEDGKR